jgi:membrane associated rhomboid family serine protease
MLEQLLNAPLTLALLVLNIGASLYALSGDRSIIDRLAFRPQRIEEHGEYYRYITAGFVHVGMGHLFFNMFTLFFFGPVLERILGPAGFLILYFGSELAAHGLSYLQNRDDPFYSAIGASGAISGVVFAFCLFFPLRNLYLFGAVPLPAIVFAVGYVVGSAYAMQQGRQDRMQGGQGGGIAHEAHLGGAVAGVILTIVITGGQAVTAFLGALGL